jgi:trk system potassium uptake protein TrkH
MNIKQDLRLLAYMQAFIALFMGIPTILATVHGEQQALIGFGYSYLAIAAFCIFVALFTRKHEDKSLGTRDGYLFVTFTWILGAAFSAIPLVISGSYPDFSSAYFEVMSGFTTTGATVLTQIENNPSSILFWRSETNWLGGMGIVVLFVALIPRIGTGGNKLVGAESVGPTKDKLTPKIQNTALILWSIYIGFSVIETILLLIGGMDLYDSVTVTFSTMAAAGFCVKNSSIGTFNSLYVDIVVTTFMMIGGANFALYYKAMTGKLKSVWRDGELKAYLSIWGTCTLIIALFLFRKEIYPTFLTALRYSAFQNASIITTTGFATANYVVWPTFAKMILLILFFVGGCAGSAGGGIKVIRVVTVVKAALVHIKQRIYTNGIFPVKVGDNVVENDVLVSITGFIAIYVVTGLIGGAIAALSNRDMMTCFAASFLCLGNIGIGFGDVGPTGNFAFFSPSLKWMFSFLMLCGRLELYTVFALFSANFWKRG